MSVAASLTRWSAALVPALILAGCAAQPEIVASRVQQERAVANWLNCEECWNRQFEHVVALGPDVIPLLRRYLEDRQACRDGDRAANLGELYERIRRANAKGAGSSRDGFVQRQLDAYCQRVRYRAAAAIVAIDRAQLPSTLRYRDGRLYTIVPKS